MSASGTKRTFPPCCTMSALGVKQTLRPSCPPATRRGGLRCEFSPPVWRMVILATRLQKLRCGEPQDQDDQNANCDVIGNGHGYRFPSSRCFAGKPLFYGDVSRVPSKDRDAAL